MCAEPACYPRCACGCGVQVMLDDNLPNHPDVVMGGKKHRWTEKGPVWLRKQGEAISQHTQKKTKKKKKKPKSGAKQHISKAKGRPAVLGSNTAEAPSSPGGGDDDAAVVAVEPTTATTALVERNSGGGGGGPDNANTAMVLSSSVDDGDGDASAMSPSPAVAVEPTSTVSAGNEGGGGGGGGGERKDDDDDDTDDEVFDPKKGLKPISIPASLDRVPPVDPYDPSYRPYQIKLGGWVRSFLVVCCCSVFGRSVFVVLPSLVARTVRLFWLVGWFVVRSFVRLFPRQD